MADRKSQGKPKASVTPQDSRESLLAAAKCVFSRKGFEGATVKDLADEADVNVSLVSYHFGGKEGLYRSCLESFGTARLEAVERILRKAATKEELKVRLKLFAEDFISIHNSERETCKMIHRGMETMDEVTLDIFKSVFIRIFQALHSFLEAAQKSGLLRKEIDSEITAMLMFGSLVHHLRMNDTLRLLGMKTLDQTAHRDKFIEHWVANQTEGILVK